MYDIVLRRNYDVVEVVPVDMGKVKRAYSLLLRFRAENRLNGEESDALREVIELLKIVKQAEG